MSSNLLVAVFGRSTFLVVESLEDGVLAETLLDAEHGFLHSALLVEGGLLLLLLSLEFLVVGKEVELDGLMLILRTSRSGLTMRSKRSITASVISFDEEVMRSRFAVPWACFGV